MSKHRLAYMIPVSAAIALLVFSLMAYAGFLTSAWVTLLACTPAILATIGIVAGMLSGMLLFSAEEEETREEAQHPDGVELFDRLGHKLADLVHRAAIRLHVHGVGH